MVALFVVDMREAEWETEWERQTKKQDGETTYNQLLCKFLFEAYAMAALEQPVGSLSGLKLFLMNINGERGGKMSDWWEWQCEVRGERKAGFTGFS